jgi:hypothetical protein
LIDSEINFLADKVHVHKWPQDTPIWSNSIQKQINDSINKKINQKQIVITGETILIENTTFSSLKKIGVSVPFFKDECTLIFEAQFENLFAHVHITKKLGNYLELFNQLMSWKNSILSE